MPKERISHFTVKKIAISSQNSATVKEKSPNVQKSTIKLRETVLVGRIRKSTKTRLAIFQQESKYAARPIARKSELIQTEIINEAKRFRKVNKSCHD